MTLFRGGIGIGGGGALPGAGNSGIVPTEDVVNLDDGVAGDVL